MEKYKLINPQETRGVWVTEEDLITLMRICKQRAPSVYNKIVDWYEYLNDKTFNEQDLSKKKRVIN